MRYLAWFVILVGCGSGSQHPIDAAVDAAIDATLVDAAPDAPMPPTYHYVADHVFLPASNTQARDYGLDLNSDGTVDNQLGMVIATFAGMGIDFGATTATAVDKGQVIELFELATFDFTNSTYATTLTLVGSNPMPAACTGTSDTVCRHHLDGTASFTATAVGNPTLLVGQFINGTFVGGPGHATLQMSFANGSTPIVLSLLGARTKLSSATPTAIPSGVLAGAIAMSEIDTKLIPGMRDAFMVEVMRDCTMLTSPPACGCASGTNGKTFLGLFDTTPQDCNISLAEVKNNSLIVSLLAPDVTVEGQQALSIGVAYTAVGATFTYP